MTKKTNQFKSPETNSKPKDAEKPSSETTSKGLFGFVKNEKFLKITGVFLLFLSGYLLFAFSSFLFTWDTDQDKMLGSLFELIFRNDLEVDNWAGKFGAIVSHQLIHKWFGVASFLFIFLAFVSSIRILFNVAVVPLSKAFRYSFFGIIFTSVFLGFVFRDSFFYLGGFFGYQINQWLIGLLGNIGTGLILAFCLLCFLIIAFNISFDWFKTPKESEEEIAEIEPQLKNELQNQIIEDPSDTPSEIEFESEVGFEEETKEEVEINTPLAVTPESAPVLEQEMVIENTNSDVQFLVEKPVENKEVVLEANTPDEMPFGEYDPTLDLSSYQYPTVDLLENYGNSTVKVKKEELEANKDKILETLRNYSIDISKIKATIGPTVTLYEIIPAPGVRISKIKNLEDDIALSLSALGIRIIAPIPGKGTIGIEVPNLEPEMVSMRSVLASEKFQNSSMDLPVALGKTISNEIFIADLAKMPHLLMAGATGQGKSVGLNAILVSLLYKKHPSQIKFVLVDPKKVELTLFAKIERHFLAKLPDSGEAIITDTTKVVHTLKSLCIEMDLRYDLLKEAQVRNLKEYNAKFIARKLNPNKGHRFLPYIVLVVDEFADLIMTAGKEVEMPIARLAQLARAIGIHLIIATQRPSVNIITGTIKANFPTRIAFRVTSKIDSRTILDTGGAEQLIGRGDMLFSPGNEVIRLQCAFVDTPEVEKITEFIGSQRGYPAAHHLPEYVDETAGDAKDFDLSEKDSFFNEAAKIIVMHQQGSASLLQRKLKLGYNRAGRIIDQLEAAGVIGPFEGSKARQVLIADEHSLEQFLNNLNNKN